MIELRRLNGVPFVLNCELIEQVEAAPDTLITLITGNNIVVLESVPEVIEKVVMYRRRTAGEREMEFQGKISKEAA